MKHRITSCCTALLLTLLALPLYGQRERAPVLRPGQARRLPAAGIELPVPRDSRDDVIPTPQVYTYQVTRGGEQFRVELYDPRELWFGEHTIGRWGDAAGTRMTLAVMEYMPPAGFEREHVSHTDYLAAERVPVNLTGPATQKTISEWVTAYRGTATFARAPETSLRQFGGLWRLGQPNNPFFIGYAFQFSRVSAGQRFAPDSWFVLLFDLATGTDPNDAEREVLRNFLPRINGFRPEAGDALETRSRRFQAGGDDGQPVATLRERILDSLRHQQDWWYAETRHYLMVSDVGTRHHVMLRSLQNELEDLRVGFAALVPPRTQFSEVSVLRIFAEEDDYVRYVGQAHAWSAGLWMPARRELVVRPLTSDRSRDVRERIRKTAYHEAFHQYLFYALNQRDTAPWFNEGHAVLFENAEFRNNRLTLQESEQLVEILLKAIEEDRIDLGRMMEMNYNEFYDNSNNMRELNYALAWGLIYYLHKGAVHENPNIYRELLTTYVNHVMQHDMRQATRLTMHNIGYDRLQNSLISFWSNRNLRARARRSEPF